jgi:hypothetical protein
VIPELRFDKTPPFGSDFYPFPVDFPQNQPGSFDGHAGFAAAATGVFEGWNVSFHFADLHESSPRLEIAPEQPTGYQFGYSRITLGGAGGDYAIGSWVLKGELAYVGGTDYATVGERARFDAMLGVEYYGIADSIALDSTGTSSTRIDGRFLTSRARTARASLRRSAIGERATTPPHSVLPAQGADGAILLHGRIRHPRRLAIGTDPDLAGGLTRRTPGSVRAKRPVPAHQVRF